MKMLLLDAKRLINSGAIFLGIIDTLRINTVPISIHCNEQRTKFVQFKLEALVIHGHKFWPIVIDQLGRGGINSRASSHNGQVYTAILLHGIQSGLVHTAFSNHGANAGGSDKGRRLLVEF